MITILFRTGNDALQERSQIADCLRAIALDLEAGRNEGPVVDGNGNTVGRWEYDPDDQAQS